MKRLLEKIARKVFFRVTSDRVSTSVSDNLIYPQVCIEASNNYRIFNNFRRDPIYNQILEHVSEELGKKYLEFVANDPEVLAALEKFKANDDYGNPRICSYRDVGEISPTTLRYIKVLVDLKKHFGKLDRLSICEIGVGYGGQCRIINAHYRPREYYLVDIAPVLSLAQRYIDNYPLDSVLVYKTLNELNYKNYDLVVSNYAFTELRRSIQDAYLEKVILRSKRGYITYNEMTPSEFNSYKAGELIEIIPDSIVLKEEPLTHPKNCLIVWGQDA